MPSLLTVTLAQLRSYTVAQIRTALNNRINAMTKKQLILMILALQSWDDADDPSVADDSQFTYHANGQWASCLGVVRDALGVKRGSRGVTRTFTPDTSVDTVVTVEYDAADTPVRRTTITYPHDGTQPGEPVVEV